MKEFLISMVAIHPYWVYGIAIGLAWAEGPVISMIGGLLIRLGYFHFIPLYLAVMLGDVIGDSVWYWVGRKFGHSFVRRFGKYVGVTGEGVGKAERIFHRYKYRILIISKLTNGLGLSIVTLITAGMIRIPFGRYLAANLVGQFFWTGFLVGIGYFLGDAYVQVDNWFGRIGIGLLFALAIWAFLAYKSYLRRKAYETP